MPTRATCPYETGPVCSDRRCQDDYRHARSPDPPLRHHRDRQYQLAIQKPQLTKPSPGPPPGLIHVGAQMLWGDRREMAPSPSDTIKTDGGSDAKAERPEQISRRP